MAGNSLLRRFQSELSRNALLSKMDPRDTANALISAPSEGAAQVGAGFLPVVGDAVGLAQDAAMYYGDPSSRTIGNGLMSLAALIPGVPNRVYHGTGRDFVNFALDAKKTTGGGFNKYGVSVSENPAVASRYAQDFFPESAHVRPLDVTVKKPLSLTAQEFEYLQTAVSKLDRGEPLSELQDIGIEQILKKRGIEYTGQHPIDAIKQFGFDAIEKDAGRYGMAETEALIFDPSQLKAAYGK